VDTASPRLRMSVIGVVVIGCFAALFARLWYLQVMEAPSLEVQATANRTRTVAVEAPRGRILDRNGKVIVDNRTSLVVTVDRTALKKLPKDQREALVSKLAATFTDFGTPTKTDAIEAKLADKQYDDLQPVPVASDVTEELMVYLSERASDFPSVGVERESVRQYNYPTVAGNILGYVGRINAETLAKAKDDPGVDPDGVTKDYQPDSTIGLAGVEAAYEKDLRGTPGTEEIEIDANNRAVRTVSYQPPRPGNDVQLNIDIDVQVKSEEALREQLRVVRGGQQRDSFGVYRKNAPAGSVVVQDPNDGAVVAMATYPSYDPAEFVNGISQERYAELSDTDGVSALIDRSITGQYAPGSTFKLVTATAALDNGIITARDTVNDKGFYEVGNPPTRFNSTGANGYIALPKALTVSSDVFFYYLGDRMDGTTDIQKAASSFGFDAPTGIDLPNESSGFVFTPDEKKALHDKYPEAYPNDTSWYTGDSIQLAIGQNVVAVTPMQLAGAYSALANGGTVYQPHVVNRVLLPSSRTGIPVDNPDTADVLRVIDPVVRSTVEMPASTRDPIVEGLSNVTRSGTAAGAFSSFDQRSFPILGKTGTAQVQGKADTSVFASYAPADDPRWTVAAVLEESGFGSEAAAPVVRHVYELLSGQPQTPYAFVAPAKVD
jgi:penicillin-binding protein 2